MSVRRRAAGVAIGVAALVSAAAAGPVGAHTGSSYRWVDPPPGERNAGPPVGTSVTFEADEAGSLSQLVATPDAQFLAVFPERAFDAAAEVVVRPREPGTLGPPPAGMAFDGNAYEVSATTPVDAPFELALRFAHAGTTIVMLDGIAWRPLPTTVTASAHQARADATLLGTFAVVGDAGDVTESGPGPGIAVVAALVLVPLVLLVVLAIVARRRRSS